MRIIPKGLTPRRDLPKPACCDLIGSPRCGPEPAPSTYPRGNIDGCRRRINQDVVFSARAGPSRIQGSQRVQQAFEIRTGMPSRVPQHASSLRLGACCASILSRSVGRAHITRSLPVTILDIAPVRIKDLVRMRVVPDVPGIDGTANDIAG